MKKIVEYRVLREGSSKKLEEMVGLCIAEGRQPLGGVSSNMWDNRTLQGVEYLQAMVKYEE